MTLHAAVYGQAFKDAEVKTSKAGTAYGTVLVAVPDGQDEEGRDRSLFVRVLAFQDAVDEMAKLKRGDRVYAEGSLSVGIYQSDKGRRPDLTLKSHHLRRTQIGKDKPKRAEPENHANAAYSAVPHAREKPQVQGRDRFDFDDRMPF